MVSYLKFKTEIFLGKVIERFLSDQVDVEILVGGGERLLIVAEVWVIEHLEGAALADGESFGLVLVEDVLQAGV